MSCNHKYYSTQLFRDALAKLLRKYPTCKEDICAELCNLTLEEIYHKKYIVSDKGHVRIIKVRIANSESGKGKSSGFRVILLVNKKLEHVAFLTAFPKIGPQGVENIEKTDSKAAVQQYCNEIKLETLNEHNIELNLDVVESAEE